MSRKFPLPMYSGLVSVFEDAAEITEMVCNKCGTQLRPIRLKRTRGVPLETITQRAVFVADAHHTCNPALVKDKDPGCGDRVVNIYHENEREKAKVGAPGFLEQAIRKTILGGSPGNA